MSEVLCLELGACSSIFPSSWPKKFLWQLHWGLCLHREFSKESVIFQLSPLSHNAESKFSLVADIISSSFLPSLSLEFFSTYLPKLPGLLRQSIDAVGYISISEQL